MSPCWGGLTYPTSVTFDEQGNAYVVEAGFSYGGVDPGGRIIMLSPTGGLSIIAEGLEGPLNGCTWHDGFLYISQGTLPEGRVLRMTLDGERDIIVDGLPTGDHHTNMVAVGPDEKLYFTNGTRTNSGVVGLDNVSWLYTFPLAHDVPSFDAGLSGENYAMPDPLALFSLGMTQTGAFHSFGQAAREGQLVEGRTRSCGRWCRRGSPATGYPGGLSHPA